MPKPSWAEIAAQIAALQAELAADDSGVYEDPETGRWFVVLRKPGRRRTTTRRRPRRIPTAHARAGLGGQGPVGGAAGRRRGGDRARALRGLLAALSALRQGRDHPGLVGGRAC